MLTTKKDGALSAQARMTPAASAAGLGARMERYKYFYILLLPAIVFYFVFNYVPMYGIVLAFKHYRFNTPSALGDLPLVSYVGQFMNMKWVGLQWFEMLWGRPDFWRAFRNTLLISFYRILFGFPAPIILALLMNEVRRTGVKRVYQTVYTFPHFLSWVLVAGVLLGVLSTNGALNQLIATLGGSKSQFLTDTSLFRGLLVSTEIWKSIGWGSIIFLAAIAGIDPQLYEAATIDGANRVRRAWHVTVPGIRPTIAILLILRIPGIVHANFEKILLLYRPITYDVADVIQTYIYRKGLLGADWTFGTASGFFLAVLNLILLLTANTVSRRVSEYRLW
jgi:putative aldouronate transport system permease protein